MRLSFRPSTIAVVAASALVFLGLFMAQQSLQHSEQASMEADANEAAAVANTFFGVQSAALSALHGLYIDSAQPPDSERFNRLVTALNSHGIEFRRIWITDTAGVVIQQRAFGSGRDSMPTGMDVDTVSRLTLRRTAERVRRTGAAAVSAVGPLFGGDTGFVILEPLALDGRFLGFAGGTVTREQLQHAFQGGGQPPQRIRLLVLTRQEAGDTVLAVAGRALPVRSPLVTGAPVALPGGGDWWVAVVYAAQSSVRLQLWGVAFAALGALLVGTWHERRQTRRIAERSLELEHLSQELLRANRAKSEFLANVSHELRTPLNAIVGFTELLRDGVYGELTARQAGPVQRIESSATHLRLLVDQVLDLAKIAAGRLEVQEEMLDLRQFVLDVVTEIEPLLTEKGLAFSLGIGAGTPRVRTDPTHLRQILVNLLGNAVKFTPQGSVTVRTRLVVPHSLAAAAIGGAIHGGLDGPDGRGMRARSPDPSASWVALQVSDTGPGITTRDQARIFDEFEQVNAGSRSGSEARGTGLGLPISRRLAVLIGGELSVQSEPGRGSTFTVWLPVRG